MKRTIDAADLLLGATTEHQSKLSLLVAATGIWANPAVHERLVRETGAVAISPKVRRSKPGQGEKVGQIVDGVRLDNNSYANVAIKRATGLGRDAKGFETCHIWPKTCYDERYHTAPANLVLLPRALASLSDHDAEVQKVLQYRAFELYGWWPETEAQPVKPDFYPANWRDPEPDPTSVPSRRAERKPRTGKTSEEPEVINKRSMPERIRLWHSKPASKVHKMIAIVAAVPGGIPRSDLARRIEAVTQSKNAYGAVASLLTDSGRAYGPAFIDEGGLIRLHPDAEALICSLSWRLP